MGAALRVILSHLPSWKTWVTLAILGLVVWTAGRYLATRHTVYVEINGQNLTHLSHQTTSEGVLRELSISLKPEDRIEAPVPRDLIEGMPIVITVARPVLLVHDGAAQEIHTHAVDVGTALAEAGISLAANDRVWLNRELADTASPLPAAALPSRAKASAIVNAIRTPLYIHVDRSLPIRIVDGDTDTETHTFGQTVAAALDGVGTVLYEGDRISPDLASPVYSNMTIHIERSLPILLDIGGITRRVRTIRSDVAGLIEEQHVALGELDYVLPEPDTAINSGLLVVVVRVLDEYLVEEIPIKFEIRYEPDPESAIDTGRIISWGQEGARRQMVHIRYENGTQTWRQVDDEWIAREPEDRVTSYGTKIVLRQLDTPKGTITYWRKLRMLATSYNAPTAGKSADHPNYGITRLGERAAKGIIAVDPQVINLRQDMYVPGYGLGYAGDTGGAIKWRRVDLCYDDDNLVLWRKWVDVYLLTPVPDEEDINWVITNYPVERE